jgi:hypothetical protein
MNAARKTATKNIHRRDAETLRKTNSKSKSKHESAEVAEDAEGPAGAV